MWFHKPVVGGSRAGLPLQKEAVRHVHGALWAVVWFQPSLTDGQGLSLFSFTGYLVPLALLLLPSLTNKDISSCKHRVKEEWSCRYNRPY